MTYSYGAVYTLFTRSYLPRSDERPEVIRPNCQILLAVVEQLARRVRNMNIDECCERFDQLWQAAEDYLDLAPAPGSAGPVIRTGPPVGPARLPNPEASNAVLIGASHFDHLEDLPQADYNLSGLHKVLIDGPHSFCLDRIKVTSPRGSAELLEAIHTGSEQATDTLIVYYVGHGLIAGDGGLYLATADTRPDALYTGTPYDTLRQAVARSRASRKLVILDCCYSGRAKPMGPLSGMSEISSAAVLASTAQYAASLGAVAGSPYSAFTGSLIALLTAGIPDGPKLLDIESVYQALVQEHARKELPKPVLHLRHEAGPQIVITANPALNPGDPFSETSRRLRRNRLLG
ncbi:caspase family protein [Streptomyces sp. NPDC001118]